MYEKIRRNINKYTNKCEIQRAEHTDIGLFMPSRNKTIVDTPVNRTTMEETETEMEMETEKEEQTEKKEAPVKKPGPIIHYTKAHNKTIREFLTGTQQLRSCPAKKHYLIPKRKEPDNQEIDAELLQLAFETVSPGVAALKKSKCCPDRKKYLRWKYPNKRDFTEERKHYKIHGTKAFVVIAPPMLTGVLKQFLYSEGGLMDLVDKQFERVKQECDSDMETRQPVDRPTDLSPAMCRGECTFVSQPIFLHREENAGRKKNALDLTYLIVSPKGLQDSKWMVGLLRHLKLDAFLKNISNAVQDLENIEKYDAVVLSQCLLFVPYYLENKDRRLCEHIDGMVGTTKENNLYSVSIPLTLLTSSGPEFHLISRTNVYMYKFERNHALCFTANQGHSTANLGTCAWLPPDNIRVNLMLVIGDRNYLKNKPEGYKEQILEMSDPCYPSAPLQMEDMLKENPGTGEGEETATWNTKWNTYVEKWMASYDDAHGYFKNCMLHPN